MGNEAADLAQEAERELIHYLSTNTFIGEVNMQTMYMTWLTMAIVFVLFFLICRKPQLVPSGLQNAMEILLDLVNGLMQNNLGSKGRKSMAPFFVTLFMFILIGNELGVFMPYQVGGHWTSPTNDINTCFGLSLTVAIGSYLVGVFQQGASYFKHFISPNPVFLPLHLLDAVTKPLTMALRLFGNILAGEILLIVLYQVSPWVVPELWVMFSLFIGFVQAFIFTILALGSYSTAFIAHEEH